MAMSTFAGPIRSTAGFISGADSLVSATASTLTVTPEDHSGRIIKLNRAAGITVTLPAATGTGNVYKFFVETTVTGDYIIKVADNTDTMAGQAIILQDAGDTLVAFEAGATADTITLNGDTSGGLKGASVILQDVSSNLWWVQVVTAATGTEETPFSATV